MEVVHDKKKNILMSNDSAIEAIISQIPPRCQALVPWIRAIWGLFCQAHAKQVAMKFAGPGAVWDNKTYGGWITFDNFIEAIGRT
ncbi:hypothetical protein DXG03_008275, partial [Asterophora parasitica]